MPSPTRIVLSSMREHGVRYLLMGGQACILYGAVEFSRDTDIAVLPEPDYVVANLASLVAARVDGHAKRPRWEGLLSGAGLGFFAHLPAIGQL